MQERNESLYHSNIILNKYKKILESCAEIIGPMEKTMTKNKAKLGQVFLHNQEFITNLQLKFS